MWVRECVKRKVSEFVWEERVCEWESEWVNEWLSSERILLNKGDAAVNEWVKEGVSKWDGCCRFRPQSFPIISLRPRRCRDSGVLGSQLNVTPWWRLFDPEKKKPENTQCHVQPCSRQPDSQRPLTSLAKDCEFLLFYRTIHIAASGGRKWCHSALSLTLCPLPYPSLLEKVSVLDWLFF